MKTTEHWNKIGLHPHHGIELPLFSLRSKKSCGIGEFNDLIPLIDWCKKLGFDCIQLLPLNDTGNDPSPYNPISSCALDPIYLSLASLAHEDLSHYASLNSLPRLDRNKVKEEKLKWFKRYFQKTFADLSQRAAYQTFVSKNEWLIPYASFKALSERYQFIHWKDWPNPREKVPQEEIEFHFFLQYLCFSQLTQVRLYAEKQSIFLKGDLSILLNPNSADVWAHQKLFRLDLSAGAPPDYYNPSGQNWGFPLFNWDEMRKDHFHWWKQRLKIMSHFYHLYRIDHVVGYFRIWSIPLGQTAADGFFIPQDRSLWKGLGQEILEMMLDASPCLPIAEDLGTIPEEVYSTLKTLGICGTKVIRWQKNKDQTYIPYKEYEPFSLTTVSTPDCDTVRMWWQHFPLEAKAFAQFNHWDYSSEISRKQLLILLHDAHHTPSYFHINLLQEYLSYFPELIWPDGDSERINIPGTLLPTNWTYRFRPFLEEMIDHSGLQKMVSDLLL